MKNQKLSQDDFPFRKDNYDSIAPQTLPHYNEAHELIGKILKGWLGHRPTRPLRALDLGTGTGFTAEVVLKSSPDISITAVDLLTNMLVGANARLTTWENPVSLVKADNLEFMRETTERYDVVTAAFCIHHLNAEGKQEIFQRIHDAMRPGGAFLLLDLTTYSNCILRDISSAATAKFLSSRVTDPNVRSEWLYHWKNVNLPDSADDQLAWLRATGFQAETVCRWLEVALLASWRL